MKRGCPKKVKIIRNPYGSKGKPIECHNTSGPRLYLTEVKIPESFEEAILSPQASKWYEAMNQELKNHEARGTWEVAELPPDRQAVGCKWQYALKNNPDNEIFWYKARLIGYIIYVCL